MINAAVVGLGTWGKTMMESLAGGSDLMRFTTLQTRTVTPDVEAFAKQHSLRVADSYEAVLADPKIDAVALATPPSGHLQQIQAAAAAGKHVYCQSFARTVQNGTDDTTSMLFRMKDGMSGYLGTMTTTGAGFSFQVFGSKGWHRLEGVTHVAGAPSEERRTRQFGVCKFQPVKGPLET